MSRKKWISGIAVGIVVALGAYFGYAQFAPKGNSRESLLRALPADASAVIYLDIEEFRRAAILKAVTTLGASATGNATADPEYKQFVSATGFDYEKDLDRVGIAVTNHGAKQNYFALTDGRFDRKKIETYLRKNGRSEQASGHEIFHVATDEPGREVSMEFISNERIALTDGDDISAQIASGASSTGHAERMERFGRLAWGPVIALSQQRAALGGGLKSRTPGGLYSPQLAALLDHLLLPFLGGKPQGGTIFAAVARG